jgi:hypothetical protein
VCSTQGTGNFGIRSKQKMELQKTFFAVSPST